MQRRKFIRNSIAISSALLYSSSLFADQISYPDLIVAKGNNISDLYQLSIKALGGLEKYNLKGKRILLKPTIQWNAIPEKRLNTNPELVSKIIRNCYDAGAWEVYVLDHTSDDWRKCYKNSGIEKASKLAYGKIIPANDIRYYGNVNSNEDYHFHDLYHKCDLLINIPKLNINQQFTFSGAITNLHGLTYENTHFTTPNINLKLASIIKTCQPILNIVDATLIDEKNQEFNSEALILSENIIYTDILSAQLLGYNPEKIEYLQQAARLTASNLKTDHLKIQNIYT